MWMEKKDRKRIVVQFLSDVPPSPLHSKYVNKFVRFSFPSVFEQERRYNKNN